MYKYKGNNPEKLLNPANYPLSFGEGDLEVVFDSVSDKDLKWAHKKIYGEDPIKKISKELAKSCKSGSAWKSLVLSELTRENYLGKPEKPNFNWSNFITYTPLMSAVIEDNIDCTKILISKKVDLNFVDVNQTALIMAAYKGHIDIVKLLVENGADISAINNEALKLAKKKKRGPVVKYLRECINKKNQSLSLLDKLEEIKIEKELTKPKSKQPKPRQDQKKISRWLKMNDHTISCEISNDDNMTVKSIFNFASREVDKVTYEIEPNGSKFILLSSTKNFKDFESQAEIGIAKEELLKKDGVIPNSKANKTVGLIERKTKGHSNV